MIRSSLLLALPGFARLLLPENTLPRASIDNSRSLGHNHNKQLGSASHSRKHHNFILISSNI
ncbi:Protein of unknown function [Pyronema omphalodes CBS 100304]|uniref:Uncharacterized protein n=1 Tax=Pyronema omphalodes (strain CBS 100304) TaxID=1076935 RepID=U4L210_PYROM|nr:Protein of unknown function [Pyronema omphalodes CBS 100304]